MTKKGIKAWKARYNPCVLGLWGKELRGYYSPPKTCPRRAMLAGGLSVRLLQSAADLKRRFFAAKKIAP